MSTTSYTQQIVREAPDIEAYKLSLLNQANQLYNTPMDLPAYEVAGLSAGQLQAADMLRQGIGAYEPFIQAGSQALTQGQTLAQQGANLAAGMDVSPQYQAAQTALGRGLSAADTMGGYAQAAGAGLGDIATGIGGLQAARQGLSPYMQANMGTSEGLLNQAALAAQGAGPSDFRGSASLLGGASGTAGLATQRAIAAGQQPGFNQGIGSFQQAATQAQQAAQLGNAPTVTASQMGPAQQVATRSFVSPGAAQDLMSPYMQGVVDIQQREARRQGDIARQGRAAQAVRAGAFGGTREAVVEAEAQRNLAQQMGDIQATGLQQAFQQAQQQFNAEQQANLAAQQANQAAGLTVGQQNLSAQQQAALANQAMQGQYGIQGAQLGLQAAGAQQALGQAQIGTAGTQAGLGLQAAAQQFQQAGFDANTAMQLAQLQQTQQQQGLQQASALQGIGGLYGQQAVQQAQLGQSGSQLAGSLAGQQAQLGLLPAQIAQTQAGIGAQQAGLYGSLGQGLGSLAGQQAGIDLQRAGLLGQTGTSIGQMGVQQGALGQAMSQLGQADVSSLMGIGAMEQANAQSQLDAMRATQMQDVMAPYQQLGFVADIYKGAPSSQSSLLATSQPSASPFQTAAGLGIAGLSAAAGAKKVGLV